ncbi:hypothetical protein C0995_009049 [Termitomyces sp. Mi166|nr:hypothetical protein C0995_009049 [Termitomyces sp. Mi166\
MTKWYQLLNSIKFANPTRAVVARVGLDQVVLTPGMSTHAFAMVNVHHSSVAVPFFFGSMSILEGKPYEAVERIKALSYETSQSTNFSTRRGVFLPTQIINFAFVPPHLRFVFVSVISLFWNTYLSAVNAQQEKLQDTAAYIADKEQEDC